MSKSERVDKTIDHQYSPIATLIMKDDSEAHHIEMTQIFDVPFAICICGPSKVSGKTNVIGNLLLSKEFYRGIYQPENIYIFCPSFDSDGKMQTIAKELHVPPGNIYKFYSEIELAKIEKKIKENYAKAKLEEDLPPYVMVIFDDCSYSGDLKNKKGGFVAKMFCNLRHYNCSCIMTAQKYTQLSTEARTNMTGAIMFACGGSDPDLFYNDVGFGMKRDKFIEAYERGTLQKHTYMVYNKTNPPETRFMDTNWMPISMPYRALKK